MDDPNRVNRRSLLAAGAGLPLASLAIVALGPAPGQSMRPDLALTETGNGRWKWLGWQHDGECWRPVRGEVRADGAGQAVVLGPLPAQDRPDLLAAMRATAPGLGVSFAPQG